MKHNLRVTLVILLIFFVAHLIGLFIVNEYLAKNLPFGIERPEVDASTSYVPILIAIFFATIVALLLVKFKAVRVWRIWFIFASIYLLTIAFNAFLNFYLSLGIALIFGLIKVFRPSYLLHNIAELFIYSGISAIFAPIMNILSVSILLILISVYDYIAVWKTKHMVSMAKFQSKTKMFAGIVVPYDKGKKMGILGGGDIGFTLLFSSVVLVSLGFLQALIVSLFTTLALFGLFVYSKKGKFYPAMPFLSAGCFLGLLVSYLI